MARKAKKQSFYKRVISSNVEESIIRLDDWGSSEFDMFIVNTEIDPSGLYEVYTVNIFGWENQLTRELYDC